MNTIIITLAILASIIAFFLPLVNFGIDATFCSLKYYRMGHFRLPRISFEFVNVKIADALRNTWKNIQDGGKALWTLVISLVAVACLILVVLALAEGVLAIDYRLCVILPLVVMGFFVLCGLSIVAAVVGANEGLKDYVGGAILLIVFALLLGVAIYLMMIVETTMSCAVFGVISVVAAHYFGDYLWR